ncbi:MAG: phytase [Alphaproteobacteria bacterium]|nr:phytase [Alphaproteobacteria bacterium]MBU2271011.1 phytase [Alphaproteobacteria bacterium]MBU2418686.1 phytase [Alphaproteobacteria bacterium]
MFQRRKYCAFLTAAGLSLLGACASIEDDGPQGVLALGDPARPVMAAVETVVTTDPAVDADDPALWADPANPARAVMFGTDKSDGLYVFNLDGGVRQFLPSGPVNNVDLRNGFPVGGATRTLVAASNDQPGGNGVNIYLFDPATLTATDYGFIATPYEPYGFCVGKRGETFYLVVTTKAGTVHQMTVAAGPDGPVVGAPRVLTLGSQLEGCVVNDRADTLYVGEEDVGVWRFDFDPAGPAAPTSIARVDLNRIKDDVEGLTIMRDGGVEYLIVSSQGDSTYPVYRIEGDEHVYLGRFAIVDGDVIDVVTSTDGLDAFSGPIGPFPRGAIAFHDDIDSPNPGQQNYKIVDWREIRTALGLQD